MAMRGMGRTYLVGGHREGVNVTLLRGISIRETQLRWAQQFRSHVTDSSRFGYCRATWLRDGGIGNDTRNSEVPKTSIALLSDQDISLGKRQSWHRCTSRPDNPCRLPGLYYSV